MTKLTHLIELLITLQYKELTTAAELSQILNVNKKTVYRYIETLLEANIPIMTKKGRYGGFYLDSSFFMKQPNLEKDELEALIMAADILTESEHYIYKKQLRNAVSKVKTIAVYDNKQLNDMQEIQKFKIKYTGIEEKIDNIMAKINISMTKSRVLDMVYYSLNKNTCNRLKLEPYTIFYKSGEWYVIGYNKSKGYIGAFSVSRIKKLKVIEEIFIKPANFSISQYIEQRSESMGESKKKIVIRFSSKVKDFINDAKWHPSQNTYFEDNGDTILQVQLEEYGDIKRWIMGFGLEAEVLEPKELRDEILNDIKSLHKIYEKII